MKYFLNALKKYAVFSGRSDRKEYFVFILAYVVPVFLVLFIDLFLENTASVFLMERGINFRSIIVTLNIISNIYQVALFLPSIAITVRRMHDTGHNGWFMFVPIYNVILVFRKGDPQINKYNVELKQQVKMRKDAENRNLLIGTWQAGAEKLIIGSETIHINNSPESGYSVSGDQIILDPGGVKTFKLLNNNTILMLTSDGFNMTFKKAAG
jgi:uncharacterized membrane protein YhaH (DUF805 family)